MMATQIYHENMFHISQYRISR